MKQRLGFDDFKEKGQTLVILLVFMIIAITITSSAVIMMVINSDSSGKMQEGTLAYNIAESGIENAALRLLRNPSYSGETLTVDEGTATISVSGTSPIIVTSVGKLRNFTRKIEMSVSYNNGLFTILSWKEIF